MHYDFKYLGSDTWRFTVLLHSGRTAVREGRIERLSRLALRAQRLLDFWSRRTANKTTLPLTRPTRPATPSAVRYHRAAATPPLTPSAVRATRAVHPDAHRPSDVRAREHPSTIPSVGVVKPHREG